MKHTHALAAGLALAVALPAFGSGPAAADTNTFIHQQTINTVLQRGLSQRGVPYVYGGGDATGPTRGTGPDADKVGFDASGLVLYSFAGAGVKLPRTSGEQCNAGHKVAPTQARPGDLICYGPGGSEGVALFLGNGRMLEATDPAVTVSPVRTLSMTPYLTRIIDS